jgi:hypothetical protein
MFDDPLLQYLDSGMQEFYETELEILSEEAKPFGLTAIFPAKVSGVIEYTLGFEDVPCFKVRGSDRLMSEAKLHQHFAREIQITLGSWLPKGA